MEHAFGGTFIATDGTKLNLAGMTFGRFNVFTERAPLQAHGSFRLKKTIGSASLLLEPTSNKVTWSNTTCPDGTKSSTNTPKTCVGHLTPPPRPAPHAFRRHPPA